MSKFKIEHLSRMIRKNPGRILNSLKNKFLQTKVPIGKRYSTNQEVMALIKYARKAKLGIVEIGVLDAGTTREIALYTKVPIYGIDPLIGDSMDEKLIGSKEIIEKNMAFYNQYFFYQDFSYNLVNSWVNNFDFIWIDGDHNYEAVKKDFDDWFPRLSPSGIIAFHDSAPVTSQLDCPHQGYAGPIRLVSELKKNSRLKFIEVADSISVFQKIQK